jgi:hypothetical protein
MIEKPYITCCSNVKSPFAPLFENAIVDQGVNEYCTLDIFKMTISTNELVKGLINRKF